MWSLLGHDSTLPPTFQSAAPNCPSWGEVRSRYTVWRFWLSFFIFLSRENLSVAGKKRLKWAKWPNWEWNLTEKQHTFACLREHKLTAPQHTMHVPASENFWLCEGITLITLLSATAHKPGHFTKGPITWRISARSTELKFCCDYMRLFQIFRPVWPGWKS